MPAVVPVYGHESWHLAFLFVFVMNTIVIEAAVVQLTMSWGCPLTTKGSILALLGAFFMRTGPGRVIWLATNIAFCMAHLPIQLLAFAIAYPIVSAVGFVISWILLMSSFEEPRV